MQIESLIVPLQFDPVQVFDEKTHRIDIVAKDYLEKADSNMRHLVPIAVEDDGNCLYHSIIAVMKYPSMTPEELRGTYRYLPCFHFLTHCKKNFS